MRRSSRFTRYASNFIVSLFVGAAVVSTIRAQETTEPADEMVDTQLEELQEPEDSSEPSFEGSFLERSKLTGDWLGRRSCLSDSGITIDISSTQYYQGVASGGQEQSFQYGGRDDYFLNFECEKLGFCPGLSLTLHGETRYGESVNSLAGTLAAPNLLLAVPQPDGAVTALTSVTFTQIVTEEFQVYGGKMNTLDDYPQPLTGANSLTGFQNTAMLYNPVYARTIPYSTFAAGFSCLEDEESVFSVIVYDTNDTPTVSGFDTFFDNGVSIYAEMIRPTTFFNRPGHQGISGTFSNGKYTSLTPTTYLDPIEGVVVVPATETGSWCVTYNFDQALWVSPEDPERMWGVFGNFGIADNNPSPVRWFASAGLSGVSRFAGRDTDSFGVAYFFVGVSEALKTLAPTVLPLRDEQGVELYYNVAVTPWCQITPDLQVIDPFREQADTALIFGLRGKIDF